MSSAWYAQSQKFFASETATDGDFLPPSAASYGEPQTHARGKNRISRHSPFGKATADADASAALRSAYLNSDKIVDGA